MKNSLSLLIAILLILAGCDAPENQEEPVTADVIIYGGTSAAVASAVQVKRMGKSVIIVCPDKHLGGLTSGGLGWTDSGKKDSVGGFAKEFYGKVYDYYDKPTTWKWQQRSDYNVFKFKKPLMDDDKRLMWAFEPHIAEQVYEDYIEEYDIPVYRNEWLDRSPDELEKDTGIRSITTLSGKTFYAKVFIDATYEGDLMAAAGVSYDVGREANSVYGETWNGVQTGVLHHHHYFGDFEVSPYKIPGDPASGVLSGISTAHPGIKGEGDNKIQAYCFRTCMTNHPDNRVPFPKPQKYEPERYELLLRIFEAGYDPMKTFNKFDPIPNRKTDTNNHGPLSTDNIGMNYDYPEADYARRREIIKEHENYQKGLLYFIATDPRIPQALQAEMNNWGLAADEFVDNGNWPHQLYIRESRRMIGVYVTTENDVLGRRQPPHPVGMGSYAMDSHNVQRYIKPDGFAENEGDIGVGPKNPYQISYGSIVPEKEECDNLIVPVCVSSSHIAYGSIRMEPVFMILGQSAGTAACLAIEDGTTVQDVNYEKLREQLVADGQRL